MDWDDLRYVLAVARAGSALRAGQTLGVNQTTVLRRLANLEADVGAALFERQRGGQTLTELGRLAVEAAEQMEAKAEGFRVALAARQRAPARTIRLTTSEALANRLVAPCMKAFRRLHPDISIELLTAVERLDVARGDADVALRSGSRPEGAGIVARRLPDVEWTLYCSRGFATEHGAPASPEEIGGRDVVALGRAGVDLPASAWLQARAPDAPVQVRSNSLVSLVGNLKAGLGLGMLPTMIGEAEPDLVRCFPPPRDLASEMWLIVREDLKAEPHVRAFTEFLTRHIRRELAERQSA